MPTVKDALMSVSINSEPSKGFDCEIGEIPLVRNGETRPICVRPEAPVSEFASIMEELKHNPEGFHRDDRCCNYCSCQICNRVLAAV